MYVDVKFYLSLLVVKRTKMFKRKAYFFCELILIRFVKIFFCMCNLCIKVFFIGVRSKYSLDPQRS